jgi:hypothetical protein
LAKTKGVFKGGKARFDPVVIRRNALKARECGRAE